MLILAYHRVNPEVKDSLSVSPATLDTQLKQLRSQGWENVVLEEAIASGDPIAHTRKFAVTFDDGYRDNYSHAFPVLKQLGMRATVFVSTTYVDTGQSFPWVTRSSSSRDIPEDDLPLTWKQLNEMVLAGVFHVGSHTLTHPLLSRLDRDAAYREIYESKQVLEDRLNVPVTSFCYPAGAFSQETIRLVDQSGYTSAVVTPNRFIPETPLTLHRVGVYRHTTPHLFNVKTHYLVAHAQKSRFCWALRRQAARLRNRGNGHTSSATSDRIR